MPITRTTYSLGNRRRDTGGQLSVTQTKAVTKAMRTRHHTAGIVCQGFVMMLDVRLVFLPRLIITQKSRRLGNPNSAAAAIAQLYASTIQHGEAARHGGIQPDITC